MVSVCYQQNMVGHLVILKNGGNWFFFEIFKKGVGAKSIVLVLV
jgi:hypothetical protein